MFGNGAGLKKTETTHKSIGVVSFISLIRLCNIERQVANTKAVEHPQGPKITKSVKMSKCLGWCGVKNTRNHSQINRDRVFC